MHKGEKLVSQMFAKYIWMKSWDTTQIIADCIKFDLWIFLSVLLVKLQYAADWYMSQV